MSFRRSMPRDLWRCCWHLIGWHWQRLLRNWMTRSLRLLRSWLIRSLGLLRSWMTSMRKTCSSFYVCDSNESCLILLDEIKAKLTSYLSSFFGAIKQASNSRNVFDCLVVAAHVVFAFFLHSFRNLFVARNVVYIFLQLAIDCNH